MNFDSSGMIMLHIGAFAFFMSLAVSGFMIVAGFLDNPNHRSNHVNATPTAGGVGIVIGLGVGMLALALFYPAYAEQGRLGALMAVALGMALLGFFDDIYDLAPMLKFALMVVLACACVYVIGPPKIFPFALGGWAVPYWLGFIGAVLWVFVLTNAVNFMDGSNGMMAVSMTISFMALSIISILVGASSAALLSFIMAAALAGFLPYNFGNTAKIFSGDVGSLLVGFCFASASLLLVSEAPAFGLLYVGPLLFLPFLTDVLLTMIMRARRKENLLEAHKSHLYQRLIGHGSSHVTVSILYGFVHLFMGVITIAALSYGMIKSVSFLALWVCILSVVYILLQRCSKDG